MIFTFTTTCKQEIKIEADDYEFAVTKFETENPKLKWISSRNY